MFTIELSGTVNQDITVTVSPQDVASTDYAGAASDVTLEAGELSETFTVATTLDNLAEADETFQVTISDDAAAALQPTPWGLASPRPRQRSATTIRSG